MQRACSRFRPRNPDLFVVGSLFANNEQGAWYDPSDLNTLFQDSAGTVPVTATGQPVGRMLDKSGRGNHATQATAGSRPTFRDINGLRYLEFDGTDDFMLTGSIDFTATDKISLFAGLRKLNDAAIGIFTELSVDSNANNGTFFITAPGGAAAATVNFASKGTIMSVTGATGLAAPVSAVISAQGDISGDVSAIRANGIAFAPNTANQGTGNYGNFPLYIGRRGGASLAFNGHFYGMVVRGVLTAASAISSTERYLAAKTGVTLA